MAEGSIIFLHISFISHISLCVQNLNEVFNNKLMATNVIKDFTHIDIITYFFMLF